MNERKPHVCPVCQGYGQIQRPPAALGTGAATDLMACPACKGACVLWDPQPVDASLEKRVADLEKVAHPQGILTDPELTEAIKRWNEAQKMKAPYTPPNPFTPGLSPDSIVDLLRPRICCGLAFPGMQIC